MSDETLFMEFVQAADRGELPDVFAFCARAEDPVAMRANISLHGSLGTSLGRFNIVEQLGSGGFGSVFLAHDPELRRQVAIKLMAGKDWARNEARSLARLRHPNIVEVYEVEEDFVVMEYVKGKTLEPSGTPHERLAILIQLASAVAYAHSEGVLSRDIKPDNVILSEEGQVKLIDFSIAHIEDDDTDLNITHSLVASPAYLAPEQIESGETGASPLSDQFSLGVLAYEFLTGVHPFRTPGGGRKQVVDSIARCSPRRPPGLSRDLQNILLKALELDPRRRYDDVGAFGRDLVAAQELRPVTVSSVNPLRVFRRHKRLFVLAASLLIAAALPLLIQKYSRMSDVRSLSLESAPEVATVLSILRTLSDDPTARRIQERLRTVPETDEWAAVAWDFQELTGLLAPIDRGRVYAPEGAKFERQEAPGEFRLIEYSPKTPLGAGYYRCDGQEFRKVSMWDQAVTIKPVVADQSGSRVVNGIRATEPILDAQGKVLVLTLDQAMEYARSKGGRLPRLAELVQMGVTEGPAIGEWVGDYLSINGSPANGALDMDLTFSYALASLVSPGEIRDDSYYAEGVFMRTNPPYLTDDGEVPSACFRVVFSTTEE